MTLLFGIRRALLINPRKYENRARVHFIPNLKVGVFVTLRTPVVVTTSEQKEKLESALNNGKIVEPEEKNEPNIVKPLSDKIESQDQQITAGYIYKILLACWVSIGIIFYIHCIVLNNMSLFIATGSLLIIFLLPAFGGYLKKDKIIKLINRLITFYNTLNKI